MRAPRLIELAKALAPPIHPQEMVLGVRHRGNYKETMSGRNSKMMGESIFDISAPHTLLMPDF